MADPTQTKDMLGRSGLIPVDAALHILLANLEGITTATKRIPLTEAFDRVLAEPVISPEDLPAQARSTMDGFAVRAVDTFGASESMPCYLNISGEVPMGVAPIGEVKKAVVIKFPREVFYLRVPTVL